MRALLLALLLALPASASDMNQPGVGPGTAVTASTLTISGAGTACFTAGAFSINCASGSLTASSVTAQGSTPGLGLRDGTKAGTLYLESSAGVACTSTGAGDLCLRSDTSGGGIAFATGGGTTRSYLANSGNFGIGTASPCSTCTLHVAGGASVTGAFAVASATFTVATTGIVSAPSQPTAIIKTNGAQNIANGTEIYFGAQDYINNGMHSVSASSSAVTIPTGGDGKYLVTCNLVYESGAGSYRGVNISVDGASISGPLIPPVSVAYTQVVFTKLYTLTAGQVIKCKSFHDQATLNMCLSNLCRLEVVKLW